LFVLRKVAQFLCGFRRNCILALLPEKLAIGMIVALVFNQKKLTSFNSGVIFIPFPLMRTALNGFWFFPEKEKT